jgi:hypothetical protein
MNLPQCSNVATNVLILQMRKLSLRKVKTLFEFAQMLNSQAVIKMS